VKGLADPEYFQQKAEEGWRLVAVEWEREAEGEGGDLRLLIEEVPYGLQVADDCLHLKDNPEELHVLMLMMELIVKDYSISRVADELNTQGLRTRRGTKWSAVSVFNMLPRLIEVGPRIFTTEEWVAKRVHFFRLWEPTLS
jgi:hypothetical protein